jgi:hypothetical protein
MEEIKKRAEYCKRFLECSDSSVIHELLEIVEHSETIEELRERLLKYDDENNNLLTKLSVFTIINAWLER